jgi:anti-anti-sigma factor
MPASNVKVEKQDGIVTVQVAGRFDFTCHQEFRRAYEQVEDVRAFRIDLAATDYIDSSALGMLLLLRESAGGRASIELVNCKPAVRRVLEIANFGSLFPLS